MDLATIAPPINLAMFCATLADERNALHKPWQAGDWVYATNGHMMVRVPAALYPGHVPAGEKHPKNAADLFATRLAEQGEFVPMPKLGRPKRCPSCSGQGLFQAMRCDCCDGDGTFMHQGYCYDCKACNDGDNPVAAGWLPCAEDLGEPRPCTECSGTGIARWQQTKIKKSEFNAGYLWKMAQLPQVRMRLAADGKSALFVGDGVEGLVMAIGTGA